MCHGQAVAAFPTPDDAESFSAQVNGYAYGNPDAAAKIAILPDIYGCGPFYQGLATHYAHKGARVYLVDTFSGLGELETGTREEAFARRGKVSDKTFVDNFQAWAGDQGVTGVLGFCLGGLYIFELARRGMNASLVGLYGFPQGLPNQDAIPVPFEYLKDVKQPFTMLLGREDPSVGTENIDALSKMAPQVPTMDLVVYEPVGHDFLPDLDSADPERKSVAQDALARCDAAMLQAA